MEKENLTVSLNAFIGDYGAPQFYLAVNAVNYEINVYAATESLPLQDPREWDTMLERVCQIYNIKGTAPNYYIIKGEDRRYWITTFYGIELTDQRMYALLMKYQQHWLWCDRNHFENFVVWDPFSHWDERAIDILDKQWQESGDPVTLGWTSVAQQGNVYYLALRESFVEMRKEDIASPPLKAINIKEGTRILKEKCAALRIKWTEPRVYIHLQAVY